jgi:hypothetical protein
VRAVALLALGVVVLAAGCGARTDLPFDDPSAADATDAAADAPPLDWPDALPDVHREDCAEAGVLAVYLLTLDGRLEAFDPAAAHFTPIGTVDCAATPSGGMPNSMAVDRRGTAYVSYHDGSLFRVDTRTASCTRTAFAHARDGWMQYGMGFSTTGGGPAEQLFVADSSYSQPSRGLATIDVTSFAFHAVGAFAPSLGDAVELTGTGDGRLFALSLDSPGPGSHIAEIDKTTARVLSSTALPLGSASAALAFAFWGGDFYTFLSADGGAPPTTVSRWRPTDGSLVTVATTPDVIVGAGVSTCAPP